MKKDIREVSIEFISLCLDAVSFINGFERISTNETMGLSDDGKKIVFTDKPKKRNVLNLSQEPIMTMVAPPVGEKEQIEKKIKKGSRTVSLLMIGSIICGLTIAPLGLYFFINLYETIHFDDFSSNGMWISLPFFIIFLVATITLFVFASRESKKVDLFKKKEIENKRDQEIYDEDLELYREQKNAWEKEKKERDDCVEYNEKEYPIEIETFNRRRKRLLDEMKKSNANGQNDEYKKILNDKSNPLSGSQFLDVDSLTNILQILKDYRANSVQEAINVLVSDRRADNLAEQHVAAIREQADFAMGQEEERTRQNNEAIMMAQEEQEKQTNILRESQERIAEENKRRGEEIQDNVADTLKRMENNAKNK
jgi:hypothetical protein